jgi:iron complex transport system permease protein
VGVIVNTKARFKIQQNDERLVLREGVAVHSYYRPNAIRVILAGMNSSSRLFLLAFVGGCAVLVSLLIGISVGAAGASIADSISALFGNHKDTQLIRVVQDIRLPRVLGALLIGACLASAGTGFQALFRNPLVSPDILGVSSGAALGAVSAMALGLTGAALQAMAFVGGIAAVFIVIGLAKLLKYQGPVTLLLCGVVIAALLSALVSVAQMLADAQSTLPGIVFWMLGSLGNITHQDVFWLLTSYAIGFTALYSQRSALDKLALGDTTAFSLGVNLARSRWVCILGATLMTATTVAVAGMVGWIGLVVPHITRWLFGSNMKLNFVMSSLLSAAMLCVIDTLARSMFTIEIPIGVATAVVGLPLFMGCLLSKRGTP